MSGAIDRTMPAQPVPCPHTSPSSSGDDHRLPVVVEHHGDGARELAHERVVAVDAAVEDADVDAVTGRVRRAPTPSSPAPASSTGARSTPTASAVRLQAGNSGRSLLVLQRLASSARRRDRVVASGRKPRVVGERWRGSPRRGGRRRGTRPRRASAAAVASGRNVGVPAAAAFAASSATSAAAARRSRAARRRPARARRRARVAIAPGAACGSASPPSPPRTPQRPRRRARRGARGA